MLRDFEISSCGKSQQRRLWHICHFLCFLSLCKRLPKKNQRREHELVSLMLLRAKNGTPDFSSDSCFWTRNCTACKCLLPRRGHQIKIFIAIRPWFHEYFLAQNRRLNMAPCSRETARNLVVISIEIERVKKSYA